MLLQLVERHLEQGEVGWFAAVVIISLFVFSCVSVIAVCIRFSIVPCKYQFPQREEDKLLLLSITESGRTEKK